MDAALQRAAGRTDAFTPRQDAVRAVGSRYIDWLVPGLLGMNIMGTGMWSTSFAIVTARTRKLLKRLVATPMPRTAYLLSLLLSRLVFLAAEVVVLVAFAWAVFGVAVHGNLGALALVCLIGALAFGGIALLTASRAKTIEGVSGLLNLVMVPMWVFSGVFFASSNFPEVIQPFVQALPLTALNDALRGGDQRRRLADRDLARAGDPGAVGRDFVCGRARSCFAGAEAATGRGLGTGD